MCRVLSCDVLQLRVGLSRFVFAVCVRVCCLLYFGFGFGFCVICVWFWFLFDLCLALLILICFGLLWF